MTSEGLSQLITKYRFLNQSKGVIRGFGYLDAAARTGHSFDGARML